MTNTTRLTKAGFIGLGLIGGSIARAIRMYHPECRIIAYDKSRETLALAVQEGVVDVAAAGIDDTFSQCSIIFLCAPVAYNSAYLAQVKSYLSDSCILTDVGSVKGLIHKDVHAAGLDRYFIGGHPMAGSEKSGYENSRPVLLENAYYVLTPTDEVSPAKVAAYEELLRSFKAIPCIMKPEEHDYVTGVISHLPHILAASLVEFVKGADGSEHLMKQLAAGGFKDITRIASSQPTMWQHICMTNSEHITEILDTYIGMLEEIRSAVARKDSGYVYRFFESARDYRNSIPEASAGAIDKSYVIYCDIVDETGGIASISTILAHDNISIRNIGIVHNREFEEGVLRIEFYDDRAKAAAVSSLQERRYIVYER